MAQLAFSMKSALLILIFTCSLECVKSLKIKERQFKLRTLLDAEEPTITSVRTHKWPTRLHGIPSGGTTIEVYGSHFNKLETAEIFLTYNSQQYKSSCRVIYSDHMECHPPRIPTEETIDVDDPKKLEVGFILNNEVKNTDFILSLYPDPQYSEFEDQEGGKKVEHFKSDYLTINGENLDWACTDTDVKVRVGTDHCNVTSISRFQLTCRPPSTQPSGFDSEGNPDSSELPEVVVIVADYLHFSIGYLIYESPATSAD